MRVAQAIVGIPIALYAAVFGYTPWEALNAALVILSGFSLCIAAFNLLPISPLDGSVAWDLMPAFIQRRRVRRDRRLARYRSCARRKRTEVPDEGADAPAREGRKYDLRH